MKVAILDDYFDTLRTLPCFGRLDAHDVEVWTDHLDDVPELSARLQDVEALVLIRERTSITAELLARLSRLRLISQRSVYPHIDVAACTARGVLLCSDMHADSPSYAAAELTWALVLAGSRQLPRQIASLRAGQWQAGVGRTLRGNVLGVLGYGRIGREVAGYGRSFGMQVRVWSSTEQHQVIDDGHRLARDQRDLFAAADVVTVHRRLVPATRGVIRAEDLAAMRPESLFVNTSRAALVAPGALLAALDRGRPGLAAVDVFDHEPLTDVQNSLLKHPNAICTPHIGYVTREEYELQFSDIFDQINAFAAGGPINMVNPEAWAGVDHRDT